MAKPLPESQIEKRSRILAQARDMMRKVGGDNLSVRELAASCNISVPTIYNQFKDKHDLMMAAGDEIFRWRLEQITLPESQPGLDQLLHLLDESYEMMVENSRISRWMFKMHPETPIRSSLLIAKSLYHNCIEKMQLLDEIAGWLPVSFLGERLYYRIRSTALEWALGHVSDRGFKHLRHCELAIFLLGISKQPLKKRVEAILKKEAHLIK